MALGRKNTGKFQVVGLSKDIRTTTMTVTDTESPLPAIPLSERNSVTVQNFSLTETVYIGRTGVQAHRNIGTTGGWEIGPEESLNFDVRDAIVLYGITESGKTALIKVLELA